MKKLTSSPVLWRGLSILAITSLAGISMVQSQHLSDQKKFDYGLYPRRNSNKVCFIYKSESSEPVTVKIYDKQLNLLFEDEIRNQTYTKINYDLSDYGNFKNFTFKISGKSGFAKLHPIRLFGESFKATILPKPQNPNRVQISYKNAKQPVEISVTDKKGNQYYNKVIEDKQFEEVLNLKPLGEGLYIVNVKSNHHEEKHQIYVND